MTSRRLSSPKPPQSALGLWAFRELQQPKPSQMDISEVREPQ